MSEKDAYIKKAEARIDQANAEIEKLWAKADEAGADAEIKYSETLQELRSKRENAEAKLDELKAAGDGALGEIQRNLEQILDEFDAAVSR